MSDLSTIQIYYKTREVCHNDVYKQLSYFRKSLLDLKTESKKTLLDNTLYWQKEVERARQEKDQEWLEKIIILESENKKLKSMFKNSMKLDDSKEWLEKINIVETENKNLLAVNQNSIKEDDFKVTNGQCLECEDKIDDLNRQLDEKVIHINRLQLALAEQSKVILELQKSYSLISLEYKRLKQKENCKVKKLESNCEINKSKIQPLS